ncbi:hypothetical protein ACN27E_12470 [Mycobacterium sp. WMMD1722]|uniref:hypothetical protein n=1 Tax=Mycobacterium sp. WMMD1722 TaxID=3404117 RepID=UPI003BF597C3
MSRVVLAGAAAAALLSACAQNTAGTAETQSPAGASTTFPSSTTSSTAARSPATSSEPAPDGLPAFGVLETTRRPLEPGEWTCEPPPPGPGTREASFSPPEPGAPQITIALPETWTSAVSPDGAKLVMTGPDGLTGTLAVTPSGPDPAAAFEQYADQQTGQAPISSLSVLPADLCGYSGQKMLGMLSGGGAPPVEYLNRIAHVWTAGPSYLVAIHVQGPQNGDGATAAAKVILADFGIRIP